MKKRNRKTRGGYTKVKNGSFFNRSYSVEFDDQEEQNIKEYKENNPRAGGLDILNALFPSMKKKYKSDAIYKIQVLTRMTGHDR